MQKGHWNITAIFVGVMLEVIGIVISIVPLLVLEHLLRWNVLLSLLLLLLRAGVILSTFCLAGYVTAKRGQPASMPHVYVVAAVGLLFGFYGIHLSILSVAAVIVGGLLFKQ